MEEIDPTELTGKLISGQVETRKLWNTWIEKSKTLMPTAPIDDGAKLSKKKFFKT